MNIKTDLSDILHVQTGLQLQVYDDKESHIAMLVSFISDLCLPKSDLDLGHKDVNFVCNTHADPDERLYKVILNLYLHLEGLPQTSIIL
jgi:hypothetical protein